MQIVSSGIAPTPTFRVDPFSEETLVQRKVNSKSQKLSAFQNMAEHLPGVSPLETLH